MPVLIFSRLQVRARYHQLGLGHGRLHQAVVPCTPPGLPRTRGHPALREHGDGPVRGPAPTYGTAAAPDP
jgi:hypothetical protein